jgi:hypothetical protein
MDDAGDVALVFAAPAVGGLRMPSAAGRGGLLREGGKKVSLLALDVFAGTEEIHVSQSVAR